MTVMKGPGKEARSLHMGRPTHWAIELLMPIQTYEQFIDEIPSSETK